MTGENIRNLKPRFCLVGTSNGVPADGYAGVFAKSPYVGRFLNFSLGFSTSALFSLRAPRLPLTESDLCILDFAVNDGVQLYNQITTSDLVRSTAVDAVRQILSAGCLPAILILPVFSLIIRGRRQEAREIYLDIAKEYKLPVFDGYHYLEYLKNQGVDVRPLFTDDMHLKRDVAAQIGARFLEGLLIALRIRRVGDPVTNSAPTYRYLNSNQIVIDDNEAVSKGTRLIASDILSIRGPCEARLDAAASEEISAIAVDWANSSGTLTLESRTSFQVPLNNQYSGDDPNRFIFGLYPIKGPVVLENDSVSLKVDATPPNPGRLALGGFVVRSAAETTFRTQLDAPLVVSDSLVKFGLVATMRDALRWNRNVFLFNNLIDFMNRKSTLTGIYTIKILGVFFDLLVENRNSATTIVEFHAEIPNRSSAKLPYFAGQTLEGVTANSILASDPTLYVDPTLSLAWFAGSQGCPVQPILSQILRSLNEGLNGKRMIFTGPSGGGFAALYYSFYVPGSLCIPTNPQTIIGAFSENAVRKYCQACFGAVDDAEIQAVLDEKITSDLTRLYAEGFPNYVVYCQNASDDHVRLHEQPFRNALPARNSAQFALVRGDWGTGHIAPPANEWSRLLSEAVNWEGDWSGFVSGADFSYLGRVERQAAIAAPTDYAASFRDISPIEPV